jgi:hypothetical protein
VIIDTQSSVDGSAILADGGVGGGGLQILLVG